MNVSALQQRLRALILGAIHCAPQDSIYSFLVWAQVLEVEAPAAPKNDSAAETSTNAPLSHTILTCA